VADVYHNHTCKSYQDTENTSPGYFFYKIKKGKIATKAGWEVTITTELAIEVYAYWD
jgi:hypothetical protein